MIGTGRVAGGRPDSAIFLFNEILVTETFAATVTPFAAGALMQVFGERLGEAVGESLGHDGAVVIVLGAESIAQFFKPDPACHREGTDVVGKFRLLRRDEIRKRSARLIALAIRLLPQEMKS